MTSDENIPLIKPGARAYLGVSVFWLALSFFWGAMLTLVLPERISQLFPHDKDRMLTVLVTTGALVATVSQIFFGAWSDVSRHRLGRRRPFLIVGTLVACLVLLLFPFARGLGTLLGVFVLLQFWINMASGPYQGLMPDRIAPSYHGAAASWMGASQIIGRIGGPIAATVLLGTQAESTLRSLGNAYIGSVPALQGIFTRLSFRHDLGLVTLMLVFAWVLGTCMLLTVWLVREKSLPRAAPASSLPALLRGVFQVPLRPYPSFVWMMVSRAGIMMGVYTVTFCMLYYVRDTLGFHDSGRSLQILTNFLLISTATGLLGTLPAGVLSDRLGRKPVLYVSNCISMAAGLAFALAHSLPMAYVAAGIFGAGFGAFSTVDWALACNLLPPREPAKYLGVWSISDTLSQVLAPLLAGPLAFVINRALGPGVGYRALMLLALVWFALGTLAIRFIKENPVAAREVSL